MEIHLIIAFIASQFLTVDSTTTLLRAWGLRNKKPWDVIVPPPKYPVYPVYHLPPVYHLRVIPRVEKVIDTYERGVVENPETPQAHSCNRHGFTYEVVHHVNVPEKDDKKGLESGPDILQIETEQIQKGVRRNRRVRAAQKLHEDEAEQVLSAIDGASLLDAISDLEQTYLSSASSLEIPQIQEAFQRLRSFVKELPSPEQAAQIKGKAALELLSEEVDDDVEYSDYEQESVRSDETTPSLMELLSVAKKHKSI